MPAVNLIVLKNEIAELSEKYKNPEVFHKYLKKIFEKYSNRVYRPGVNVQVKSTVPEYHVNPLVLLHMERQLQPFFQNHPQETLEIVDQLWTDKYFEIKQLASILTGLVPISYEEDILDRISKWEKITPERSILDSLFKNGSLQLRKTSSKKWILLIGSWIQKNTPRDLTASCRALISLVQDVEYENLPVIFNMFSNMVTSYQAVPERDFQDLLLALFKRETKETLFFLKQLLTIGIPEQLVSSIRRLIPDLPKEIQPKIREMIPRNN